MSNNFKKHFFAVLIITAITLTGCEELQTDESFDTITVPPQRLRQIQTLDLQSMQIPEKTAPEPNQPMQKELQLSLEQCRALALEHNLDLNVQLINPAIAEEQLSEEQAKFEAAFSANISHSKTDAPTSTDLVGTKSDRSNIDLGVEVPLRTGGTVTFDVVDNRTKTNNEFSTFNPAYSTDFTISISQPLLRNAGKRANTHSIRLARYDRQITDARTKLEVITVIAATDRLYWRLYAARRQLEVRKKQYDLANAHLQRAKRFVEAGERPQVEVTRAEAGAAQQLEAIIIAENILRDRQRELKRALNKPNMPIYSPTTLIPATEPDPVHFQLDGAKLITLAMDSRMDLLETELQIARDISSVDFYRNQALPLVTVDYTYNLNGLGPTRSDAYDVLYGTHFEDHRFGLNLLVPLGNQAAKSKLRQAFYLRRQRLATKQNRESLIQLEVLNALDQLEANWQRILASRQTTILNGRLYDAEMRQFEIGLRTSTDVLEAQTTFADAQSTEINALTEYQIAMVDMAYATGTLLGAAKVQWKPVVPKY